MSKLRIGFLVPSYPPQSASHMPAVMQALADAGVAVDLVPPSKRVVDLSSVRVEHAVNGTPPVQRDLLPRDGRPVAEPDQQLAQQQVTTASRRLLIALGVLPGYRGVWRSMHFSGRIPIETAWRVWPGWTERALTREVPSVESATPAASAQPSERLH